MPSNLSSREQQRIYTYGIMGDMQHLNKWCGAKRLIRCFKSNDNTNLILIVNLRPGSKTLLLL